jgi:hypothetical protein
MSPFVLGACCTASPTRIRQSVRSSRCIDTDWIVTGGGVTLSETIFAAAGRFSYMAS